MASTLLRNGLMTWSGSQDNEGHRTYKATFRTKGTKRDGPAKAMTTPGLPLPGSMWLFFDDVDEWAFCYPEMSASPEVDDGEPNEYWRVEKTFSTKPLKKCAEEIFTDPLLQPPKLQGSFVNKMEEARYDRFGNPIVSSSWEPISGPQVEFEEGNPQVRIEQNVPLLQLPLLTIMHNTVNAFPLWGLPPRTIKMKVEGWEPKYHTNCMKYFTRHLTFDINFNTWDKLLRDEGAKVLKGKWGGDNGNRWVLQDIDGEPPNRFNPAHFMRFHDPKGNLQRAILDGFGEPWDPNPPDTTDDCNDCPDGAPQAWIVYGWNKDDPTETIQLDYTTDCTWSTSGTADADMILTTIGNFFALSDNETGTLWSINHLDFQCLAPNVLRRVSGPGPAAVELAIPTNPPPGQIYVQKYRESDFLQLGIPAVIGN